jgi:seryl-tRNA synthetase
MLDARFVLENSELVAQNCRDRQVAIDISTFLNAENNRRALSRQLQDLQAQINALARTQDLSREDRRSRGRILKEEERKTIADLASVEARADAI